MINKIVRWSEPFGSGKYGYTAEATAEEIINYMKEEYQETHKNHKNYPYKSDQEALDDFVAIHWASVYD
jgi:hypothetical protein